MTHPDLKSLAAELRKLESLATPGPWEAGFGPDPSIDAANEYTVCYQVCSGAGDASNDGVENAALITFLRNNAATLAECLEENAKLLSANHGAAVCAKHTAEFTRDGCLVCDAADAEKLAKTACEQVELLAQDDESKKELLRLQERVAALEREVNRKTPLSDEVFLNTVIERDKLLAELEKAESALAARQSGMPPCVVDLCDSVGCGGGGDFGLCSTCRERLAAVESFYAPASEGQGDKEEK